MATAIAAATGVVMPEPIAANMRAAYSRPGVNAAADKRLASTKIARPVRMTVRRRNPPVIAMSIGEVSA